jgi:SAM-dependent MidA family methyltransferase
MASPAASAPSPEFLAVFREHADSGATMTFERFMRLALYHPRVGYYRRPQRRVGYGPGSDFFTSASSGPIFGELITAACLALLGGSNPRGMTFVEIGAEPSEAGVLAGVNHPFGGVLTLRLGEPLALKGPCIVFSNELFDAQPCRRFAFREGGWRELAVRLSDGRLTEVEAGAPDPGIPPLLPSTASEGFVIDSPLAAVALLEQIASQPWSGLFVACDYGKTWHELTEDTPAGTLRAYRSHRQSNDLLASPGEQDLTCHVCWDWLIESLAKNGFSDPLVESQEAFFIHHAAAFIAATSEAEASRLSRKKLALMQLLHPSHMGQKFQVLHALRGPPP